MLYADFESILKPVDDNKMKQPLRPCDGAEAAYAWLRVDQPSGKVYA